MPPKAVEQEKTPQQKLEDGRKALQQEGDRRYPNMDELPEFTDGIVLANIREYYERVPEAPKEPPAGGSTGWSPIFTQVGPILIALNPFVNNFPMYERCWQDVYHKAGSAGAIQTAWRTFGPHCFGTIEQVYQELKRASQQSVVICGESGAGKTFTNKLMLDYLLDKGQALERSVAPRKSMVNDRGDPASDETKVAVASANELLEAFGNAKTGRNDNSSRFGKFTQLYFNANKDDQLVVHYPKVKTYLLERSRVVTVPKGERNYHIFHYLANADALKENGGDASQATFDYIKEAQSVKKNEFKNGEALPFDDVDGYKVIKQQMADAGFSEEYTKNVFQLITGILYLGNATFVDGDDSSSQACSLEASSSATFKIACELLGVSVDTMTEALTHQMMPTTNAEGKLELKLVPSYKKSDAEAQRDAVAKQVYSKIFDDIVAFMNDTLGKGKQGSGNGKYIGMLDIFGFEDMPKNGFEQMFINLTNETIQQLFNDVFFGLELEVYNAEGVEIDASDVKQDSGPALDLFCQSQGAKCGIIKKLNDLATSKNQKPLDGDALVGAWNTQLKSYEKYRECDPKGGSEFQTTKKKKAEKWKARGIQLPEVKYNNCFMVDHYAGKVIYTVEDFVPKSKDKLASHIGDLLAESTNTYMANVMKKDGIEEKGTKSVGLAFKDDLDELITTLRAGPCVFVRCIKPKSRSDEPFNVEEVYEQLKNGGVIAALDIRSKGFPDRKDYAEFVNEFWCLEKGNMSGADTRDLTTSPKERTQALLKMFVGSESETTYKMGLTKAFMKTGILSRLREAKDVIKERCARLVKRKWRAIAGMNLSTAMMAFEDRILQAHDRASDNGVGEVELVKKAQEECEQFLESTNQKLEQDPVISAALEAARNRPAGQMLTKQAEIDLAKIGDSMDPEKQKLEELIGGLEETIRKVLERRTKAEERLSALVVELRLQTDKLVESVDEVKGCCRNMNDQKQADCAKQCQTANEQVTKMLQEDFPRLIQEALAAYVKNSLSGDIASETPNVQLPKEADEILAACKVTVEAATKSGKELIEKKRKFEHEAYNASPELKDLHDRRAKAKENLNNMQDVSTEAIKSGFNLVSEAIAHAETIDEEIEKIREENTDARLFIEKINEYIKAEEAARDAVERVEKLKQEKAERDEKVRKTLFTGFAKSAELIQLHTSLSKQLEDLAMHVEDLLEAEAEEVDGLTSERAAKENFHELVLQVMERLEELKFGDLTDGEAAVQGITFCYKGPWDTERFKILGTEAEPYEGMARILDKEAFPKIIDAVEALNAGVLTVDDGYCIAWSETWQRYYILFTEAAEAKVTEMLKDTKEEVDVRQHKARALQFQKAVGGALKALEVKEIQAKLDSQQQELENKIRDAVKGELQKNYDRRVQVETETKTVTIRDKADQVISATEKEQMEALKQQKQAEAEFQSQISYLMLELERVQIRTGIMGAMPALYATLIDINKDCRKLRRVCQNVRDQAKGEVADMQDAIQTCQALLNNPESLPGLRNLITTMARCQKRHAETETAATDMAMEPEYQHLGYARYQMTQVALKVKRVCDGSVTYRNGLEEELASILRDLEECQTSFEQIRNNFSAWHLRIENAVAFIQHAMDCIDVKTNQMDHVKGNMAKKDGKGFWDKMFSGVMDSFCATERSLDTSGNVQLAGSGGGSGVVELLKKSKAERGDAPPELPKTKRPGFHLSVGDVVEDVQTRTFKGVIRFMGTTKFAAGDWVGIELPGPRGKNDGSVNGIYYFNCPAKHGVFLRPNAVVKCFNHGDRSIEEYAQGSSPTDSRR